jgi:hypothetical protein
MLIARGPDGENARTRYFERLQRREEERRDSGPRDLVERSLIRVGKRVSYHERVTTLDIQYPRSPPLALHKHNSSIIIADAAKWIS